jgi:hypothetical protein
MRYDHWIIRLGPAMINIMSSMRMSSGPPIPKIFTPQHSDARVLDQIVYKWHHSRQVIGRVLAEKYGDLAATGWMPTRDEIERGVKNLFGGAFDEFCALQLP